MPPNRSKTVSIAPMTCASSATSTWTNSALPAPSAATSCGPASSFTSNIATLPPRRTNSSHVPRPMPDAPPVTTATLPLMSMLVLTIENSERARPKHVARDDELLDFGRAIRNRQDARVAEVPFDAKLLGDATPAMDLHRFRRDAYGHLGRVPLGHRRFGVAAHAFLQHRHRAQAQQALRVELGGHLGDVGLDHLVSRNRLAVLDTLLRIARRVFERGPGNAHAGQADVDARTLERLQSLLEPRAAAAEYRVRG